MLQADAADIVIATFDARIQREALLLHELALIAAAVHHAAIELIDLKVVRRVGRHVPVVALRVDRGAPVVPREAPRCDPTRGLADGGPIERAERIGAYGRADRALGNLLRRVPRRVIAGKSELELTERGRVRVLP